MRISREHKMHYAFEKKIISIIYKYMQEVEGIYLVGSYARGEQEKDSDIDVLVITEKTHTRIEQGKYSIKLIPLKKIYSYIKSKPLRIYTMLYESKPFLNAHLIASLRREKVLKKHILSYIPDIKKMIKGKVPFKVTSKESSAAALDFMMKRLREIFFMEDMLDTNLKYSRTEFIRWLRRESNFSPAEFKQITLAFYRTKRKKLPVKIISQEVIDKLFAFLMAQVKKYSALKKKHSKSTKKIEIVS